MLARGGFSSASAFGFASAGAGHSDYVVGQQPSAQLPRAKAVESWTLTAEQVEKWLKRAGVGESLVYAHGPSLIDGAAAALVRKLGQEDVLHPFQRRTPDGGSDYVARVLRVRVVRERNRAPPKIDTSMLAVLTVFQSAAAEGRRAPSDAGIAAATTLSEREVKYQVEKLKRDRIIETRIVAAPGEPRFRIVRILATGMETAAPQGGQSSWSGPSNPTEAGR